MLNKQIPVSLVIPTYNRVQKLVRLLRSVDQMRDYPEEIIIIDDNSNDGTKRILKKWRNIEKTYEKKVILKSKNNGPANSRNIGISEAKSSIIAFLDDDVIVERNWINNITSKLLNSKNEKLAGVGGAVKSIRKDIISQYYTEHKILEAPGSLLYLPTLNCCFRQEILKGVGGFDESFLFAGGEDTDICLRILNQGYYFAKSASAIVYHDFSPNLINFCRRWIRYGKGTQLAIFNMNDGGH